MTGTMTFRVVARDERLPPELQARLLERASGVSYHLVGIDPHGLQQIWYVGFNTVEVSMPLASDPR